MSRPRVFIVHEPMRRDPRSKEMVPAHDLRPASQFGDLKFILPGAVRPALDPESSLPAIRDAMSGFMEDDYLAMVGDMNLVIWAAALGLRATGGIMKLLKWNNQDRCYVATQARLWDDAMGNR